MQEIVAMSAEAEAELKKRRRVKAFKKNLTGYLYIAPVLLGILLLTAFPVVYAFVTSFFDFVKGDFVFENFGFQNYIKPFQFGTAESFRFWKSLQVTFGFALVNIPLTLVLSFALAVFLNQKLRGIGFFRVLYYLPVMMPAVCTGLVWQNITNYDYGIANTILNAVGIPSFKWFTSSSTALPSYIIVGLFGIGGPMIMWLAQLKNVPEALYESSKLDGAGYFCRLFRITVPMCTPMIFYNMIMSLIATMQTFTSVVTLTSTDYGSDLLFYVINVYNETFLGRQLGYGAALSFILMIIIGLLTLLVFRTNKWVYYGEEA